MLNSLLTSKKEIFVEPKGDAAEEYTITVDGTVPEKQYTNPNDSLSTSNGITTIQGMADYGDVYVVEGEVQNVDGNVTVTTQEVISANYSSVIYSMAGLLVGAVLLRISLG